MKKKDTSNRVSSEFLSLNSCGKQKFHNAQNHIVRENGRMDYHILYIAEGSCHVTRHGKTEKLSAGNIVFFKPFEYQEYLMLPEDKPVSYYIHYSGTGCEHILKLLDLYDDETLYLGKNIYFEEAFNRLLREYVLKRQGYQSFCSAYLLEVLSVISRYSKADRSEISRQNEQIVEAALRTIFDNPKTISVKQLADDAHLSIGYFCKVFKKSTKMSPQQYINSLKLQKAKDLLLQTDFPIWKIAEDSGYPDQNYFSRHFKKETGISPSEFRK